MPENSPLQMAQRLVSLPFRGKQRPRMAGTITAIELDGSILRLVLAQTTHHQTTIQRVVAHRLDLPADADRTDVNVVGASLARAINQLGLKPGPILMGVPRNQVVLRTLTLPVLKDIRELASMVHFQISKDLPFRMEDAVIDFKIRRRIAPPPPAPRSDPNPKPDAVTGETALITPPKLEVLVACLKRDVVEFYQQLASAADLRLAALGLLPYANVRCLEACQTDIDESAVALVSLRPDEINIDVIAEQALLFSRGTTLRSHVELTPPTDVPTQEAADARGRDSFAEAATIEVVRTLHAYGGMDPANPVRQVVVTGATGLEQKVVDSLSQRFTAVCRLLNVAEALRLPEESKSSAAGAMGSIGLALGINDPNGLPFDFLNPKRPAVQRDLRRIRILASIAALAAVFVFVLAIRTHLINRRNDILKGVQAELADAKTKQPIYRKMIQQATSVEDWIHGEHNWLEHTAFLSAIMPPSEEVYLTSISVGSQNVIRLAVQARSGESLAKLEKQLRNAGYNVKPLAITPGADRYGYEFRSNVELVVPEKMKIDLTKVRPTPRPTDDASLDPGVVRRGGGPG